MISPVLQVRPGQERPYDHNSERDLANLLKFHDALQDTLKNKRSVVGQEHVAQRSNSQGQGHITNLHLCLLHMYYS